KALEFGAKVVTLSDSSGYIYEQDGFDQEKLAFVIDLKNERRGRIREYVDQYPSAEYVEGETPRKVKCDNAVPCATETDLKGEDAKALIANGCISVAEGANMPCTPEAIEVFEEAKILFGPGKAANAGGVAVSGLEMSQNSQRFSWSAEEVDSKLKAIMKQI